MTNLIQKILSVEKSASDRTESDRAWHSLQIFTKNVVNPEANYKRASDRTESDRAWHSLQIFTKNVVNPEANCKRG